MNPEADKENAMPCTNYEDHERGIDHRHYIGNLAVDRPYLRWTAEDGCSGYGCAHCLPESGRYSIAFVDRDGIPYEKDARRYGDVLANVIRELPNAPHRES